MLASFASYRSWVGLRVLGSAKFLVIRFQYLHSAFSVLHFAFILHPSSFILGKQSPIPYSLYSLYRQMIFRLTLQHVGEDIATFVDLFFIYCHGRQQADDRAIGAIQE